MRVQYWQSLSDEWIEASVNEIRITTIGGTDVAVYEDDIDEYISFEDNPISRSVSTDSSKPRYSVCRDNKWYGLDDQFNTVTEGFRTHKELKNKLGVDSVTGYTYNGDKYYGLTYHPEEMEGLL